MFAELGGLLDRALKDTGRILDRALSERLPTLPPAPPQPEEPLRASAPHFDAGQIDYFQFKYLLLQHAKLNSFPRATPDAIDLGPLHRYVRDLWNRSADRGVEYGRAGVLNVQDGTLTLTRSEPGEEGSCWVKIPPLGLVEHYVLMMHTHPLDRRIREDNGAQLHLSDEDFKAFFCRDSLVASLVTSGDQTALVMKTSSTPRNLSKEALDRRLENLLREKIEGPLLGSFNQRTWEFTRMVALELGCSLYRNSARMPHVLAKVPVTGEI